MASAVDHLTNFYVSSLFIYGKYVKILSWSTAVTISKFADKYENNAEKNSKIAENMFDENCLTHCKN